MAALPSILLAGAAGCLGGLVSAIPVGPVNVALMNEGARRGFKRAALIGLGAVLMEATYCFIAFSGMASFFIRDHVRVVMEVFSLLFMLGVGIKFLLAKSTDMSAPLGASVAGFEQRISQRFHPHSAILIGLVSVLGNLGVLVFWVMLAAHFIAREWVTPDWSGKLACVAGVVLGMSLWFAAVSYAAALGHGKFSRHTLRRIEQGSGVALLLMALAQGLYLTWQITHHRW